MKHRCGLFGAYLLAIGLLFASAWSVAGPVLKRRVDAVGTGSVNARILASFQTHIRPAQEWYVTVLDGGTPSTAQFAAFSRQFATATFVSFTYEYTVNGRSMQRVYHARSGHNEPNTGMAGVRAPRSYRSFFTHQGADIVAWHDARPNTSTVTVSPVPGDNFPQQRKRDAELKVAQRIERDILAGRVPAGGQLYGFSSQEPCASCEAALQALSDRRNITVRVSFLGFGSAAYTAFDRLRHQHLTSIEVAVNGGQLNLLNQSAESPDARVGVACIDTPGDGEVAD